VYGHGTFNRGRTAAISGQQNKDGTPSGVPVGYIFTVNDKGSFFNAKSGDSTFTVDGRAYNVNTMKARAFILVHELGHQMSDMQGAAGFQSDALNEKAGRATDKLVDTNCRKLIEDLK
jgi:hypothetical protein